MSSVFIFNHSKKKLKGLPPLGGFTLIELLVVIAIIGLLSTLAVVSLNGARAKARDAKRISDVRQMAGILEQEAGVNPSAALTVCTGADAKTSTCTGPGEVSQFTRFADPSGSATACATAAAGTASTAPCAYSIETGNGASGGAGATVSNYKITFVLEQTNTNIAVPLTTSGLIANQISCIKTGAIWGTGTGQPNINGCL